ncbi:RNA polymerase sigma factor [Solimonas fluminis]|uniref:RNA polymerase sigma factor n=1 Tax=Solimonas fluminis TaxID=2086571 RepID=A0A2S5TJP0_9GAMM|nr:RNA polymerase sigma factor [Solimonas fluminis]
MNAAVTVDATLTSKLGGVSTADLQSLDAFLASVERRAFRMAEVATRDRDEALDIVQDAMLQLSRRYAARPAQEWPALFYRIVENRIRDWQRRQTVKNRLFFWRAPARDEEEDEDPMALVPEPGAGPQEELQKVEQMRRLEQALRSLPARQREAFELRLWEGLSVEDTARAMGCSDGSVKTHLHRALAALRQELEGVWP